MPAYVAVQIDIHDDVTYDRYRALAPASIAAHQGRYLALRQSSAHTEMLLVEGIS